MVANVLAMAERCEEIKATIRSAVPPDIAEAIFIEAGRRSVYSATRLDDALQQAFRRYLTGEEADGTS